MKWISPFSVVAAIQLVSVLASPANQIVKRTSTSEGVTTGGTGGTTTTVTTLSASPLWFPTTQPRSSSSAVHNTVVKIGSNTSMLGASGSLPQRRRSSRPRRIKRTSPPLVTLRCRPEP
ncbi:uncharacterized protein BT62DRAFT_1011407 [Guyanagaster necrorhizus]|uniref:Uncharacterized protein n=1 Tax=Guyanagaster necrorhizus TaxID=856835 RepID=A0A9P7VID1_9AGAR|nr:uncharacterized protein BT62DRAFT_1011407 [Guyanagaster necrorhizus MCA 3950]KAG7441601.1 hypothetical protein BT62DRAFT_1011407 [Guyanagaster necrorhizus MCA 3950]